VDPEAETEVKDEAPAPAEADNAAPSALAATPNLIEPLVDEAAKPIEPVQPPARARPSDPIIGELTAQRARRREAEERAAQVARENADLRAMVDRLSKGPASQQDLPRSQQPQPPLDAAAIDRMAEYKLFLRDVETLRARGTSQYGAEFTNTIRNLGAVGADQDPFVHSVLAVGGDKAHELLHELAQDIDKTVGLVNMRPEHRIAELTRMTMKAQQAVPAAAEAAKPAAVGRGVSKAPAPAPALNSSTSKTVDWRDDKASDEEFTRGFQEMMQKRRGGRF
jgi:hypothetical protein